MFPRKLTPEEEFGLTSEELHEYRIKFWSSVVAVYAVVIGIWLYLILR